MKGVVSEVGSEGFKSEKCWISDHLLYIHKIGLRLVGAADALSFYHFEVWSCFVCLFFKGIGTTISYHYIFIKIY